MNLHLGIDLGSISLKVALLDPNGDVAFSRWVRVAGAPIDTLKNLLKELWLLYPDVCISSMGVTGSGRDLIGEWIDAVPINEISAQAAACRAINPDIGSIIEIGGQDSKLIILDRHSTSSISDFRMNELCAAGTGAFLDQQAARLKLSIEEFANLALIAKDPAPIAGRCAVFAKTDMTHHQQEGRNLPDIIAGLNEALVRSYLANMVRGRKLPRPISFQGGVAANTGLAIAFKRILNLKESEFIISEYYLVMGAIGAAIISSKKPESKTKKLSEIIQALCHNEFKPSFVKTSSKRCERLTAPPLKPIEPIFDFLKLDGIYLGIDVGSVSVKLAVIGPQGLIFSDYQMSAGRPIDLLGKMLSNMDKKLEITSFNGAGVTGSGRHFIGKLIGADITQNEITAQICAAVAIKPDVDTIVEIGGQDAKFMRVSQGRASYFAMNRVCAAGTGAFLEEQAKRLNVDIKEEFAAEAFKSKSPAMLGARCTVFMESDLVAHQQQGFSKSDLIAGLSQSVVLNYIEKVVSGHSMGENILFIGGVAENRSVVAALESKIGRPIVTSTVGKVSGAFGAALAAFRAKRDGLYSKTGLQLSVIYQNYDQFTCTECPNRCRITKTKDTPPKTFGGRCGQWENLTRQTKQRKTTPFKIRQKLFDTCPTNVSNPLSHKGRGDYDTVSKGRESAFRIGIPQALFAFDRLPMWRTFFESLGCEVVVSPASNDKIFAEGMKHLVVETCLPVKAFCAHLHWLEKHGNVDFIFVPSLVITGEDIHGKETAHCPYIQSLAQFAKPMTSLPLLNPVVNWRLHPKDEELAMLKIATDLGKTDKAGKAAWQKAKEIDADIRRKLFEVGSGVILKLKKHEIPRAFVIFGKDYNICDSRLNLKAVELLESQNEVVITQDMLVEDDGSYSAAYRTMYWSHGKEILAAAEIAAKTPKLYPVFITSFGCGPDSFTIGFVRDILGNKPMLLLEVDEHSSSVGMETRIEAFLDSLPKKETKKPKASRPAFKAPRGINRVFLPNFSDHSLAFAATIRALGFTPVLTDLPDDTSAKLGAAHATSGECHPFVLMLGDYLKVASKDEDFSDACYFMPESGACRVGQFGTQMRLAAEKVKSKLPIFTRVEDLAPSIKKPSFTTSVRASTLYWEMMRGADFLMQKFFETRAYEKSPGLTDSAWKDIRQKLLALILENKAHEGLLLAKSLLDRVPVDPTQKRVKIGITGDYYTRVCDYANSDIFRDIEKLGGVVMLPPTMSEFVKYNAYQKPRASFNHRNVRELLKALILRSQVEKKESRVRSIFGDSLSYNVPLEYNRAVKLIKPYMNHKLPAGLTGSVASIMEQISAGADGILNLITFHCTYGLVLSSVLNLINRDHPNIPKLTLIFEGLKPTHNKTRLEAFMERVHERKK